MTTPVASGHLASTGLPSEREGFAVSRTRRPIPSPLQASETLRSASDASSLRTSPPPPNHSPSKSRATYSTTAVPAAPAPAQIHTRAPNPAKRVPGNPELDEIRSAVTRDALREQAEKTAARNQSNAQRNISAPVLTAAPLTSPPRSPNMSSLSKPATANRRDLQSIMPRNPSIDSTVSSISSASGSQKVNGSNTFRVSQESSRPEDVIALVAASGSAEAAIQKLINEKNQAASHNAQLWRLVEKQRTMILGLNKDLEKALKEKDRYRKKVKDSLAQSQSAPLLTAANHQLADLVDRDNDTSPTVVEGGTSTATVRDIVRDGSMDSRKASETSDVASSGQARSDTPQDISNAPSSVSPATPQSTQSGNAFSHEMDRIEIAPASIYEKHTTAVAPAQRTIAQSPPTSLSQQQPAPSQVEHKKNASISSVATPPPTAASFSSPKSKISRKAPPTPLNLASQSNAGAIAATQVMNNIVDASDSEYEDDPDSARAEQLLRGRRKTREEDDREREMIAREEDEYRSQSKKDKKSRSKQPASISEVPSEMLPPTSVNAAAHEAIRGQGDKPFTYEDPAAIVRQQVIASSAAMLQKSSTAPSLLSPGLPLSPRPGDRPLNSPMPRAPINSIPMSPKSGMAGLPLSPRPPRQPIPLPPQIPLALASPHLVRAGAYQTTQPQTSSLANVLRSLPKGSPEHERPSTSNDAYSMTPGEIFSGLVTDQYPDLLLPPNALPSIYVHTASSRMRPSRQSYIAQRVVDENPVFTLAVHARSDNKQLWRAEKTYAALAQLDAEVKATSGFRETLPDRTLFSGHAPAKIDARRDALDWYFDHMLESVTQDKPAKIVCKFLSTDAIGAAEGGDYSGGTVEARPDTPMNKLRPHREGYLTKRGKNFGGWKARYFVLDGPLLKYYDYRGGGLLSSIKLQNAQIGKQSNTNDSHHEDEDNQFRHAFLILEPKKKDSTSLVRHVLCAESDEERDMWVDALLAYVDYKEDLEEVAAKATLAPAEVNLHPPRSPRLQKSLNDLRPSSRSREVIEQTPDTLRAVGYSETVARDAPIMGPAPEAAKADTPSPPYDGHFGGVALDQSSSGHPNISGPTNFHKISNTEDWGMKHLPAPHGGRDKKRSIFAGFRGRSSSDLAPGEKITSPGLPPQDHFATGSLRAVFGVPLAEAVEFARPAGIVTELPAVVYRCIQYLFAKNAVAEEGIFRLSGSNTVIKALKDRFNTEGDVDLTADDNYYDIHAVASLLKLYLRELPSSILTRDLHLEFLACAERHGREKVVALNLLVNRLPGVNRELLQALSHFLLSIVENANINKMNVRNVGIVFAPTLNLTAPLISSFVEDYSTIFGERIDEAESPIKSHEVSAPAAGQIDLRSPRKQMFSDLPTPAYNQTSFQSFGALHGDNTGMIPMHPTYANYQMAPQGEGGFGSLNDALRSPTVMKTTANGAPSSRDTKARRRESGMLGFSLPAGIQKRPSRSKLREDEGVSF